MLTDTNDDGWVYIYRMSQRKCWRHDALPVGWEIVDFTRGDFVECQLARKRLTNLTEEDLQLMLAYEKEPEGWIGQYPPSNSKKSIEENNRIPPQDPWLPIKDTAAIAVLMKLQEEMSEASIELSRCILMGPNKLSPDSQKTNSSKTNLALLLDELVDIRVCITLLYEFFNVDAHADAYMDRIITKLAHKRTWLQQIHAHNSLKEQ